MTPLATEFFPFLRTSLNSTHTLRYIAEFHSLRNLKRKPTVNYYFYCHSDNMSAILNPVHCDILYYTIFYCVLYIVLYCIVPRAVRMCIVLYYTVCCAYVYCTVCCAYVYCTVFYCVLGTVYLMYCTILCCLCVALYMYGAVCWVYVCHQRHVMILSSGQLTHPHFSSDKG